MATSVASIRVHCTVCRWQGRRTRREEGLPGCPTCGAALVSGAVHQENKKAVKARAELAAFERGARV